LASARIRSARFSGGSFFSAFSARKSFRFLSDGFDGGVVELGRVIRGLRELRVDEGEILVVEVVEGARSLRFCLNCLALDTGLFLVVELRRQVGNVLVLLRGLLVLQPTLMLGLGLRLEPGSGVLWGAIQAQGDLVLELVRIAVLGQIPELLQRQPHLVDGLAADLAEYWESDQPPVAQLLGPEPPFAPRLLAVDTAEPGDRNQEGVAGRIDATRGLHAALRRGRPAQPGVVLVALCLGGG